MQMLVRALRVLGRRKSRVDERLGTSFGYLIFFMESSRGVRQEKDVNICGFCGG